MSDPSLDDFPWPRREPCDMPETYRRLREEAPVVRATLSSGQPVWLVSTYELVQRVLVSEGVSSEHSHPAFPGVFPVRQKRSADGVPPKLAYSGMDGREHSKHRQLVASEFSKVEIDKLAGLVRIAAVEQAAEYAAQRTPADLVAGFARPLVAKTIGAFLGLPADMVVLCARLADVVLGDGRDPTAVDQASHSLRWAVTDLLRQRIASPKDDLVGRLVRRYVEAGEYDENQLNRLVVSLITAGLETTASMISVSILTLLRHPEQLALLRSDPSLLPRAVNELLRYLSVADIVTARVATASVRLGAYEIPAGSGIVALTGSANRDERAFPDADSLDIRRPAEHHLAFGHGRHKCLGQHLAKLILDSAIRALLDHLRNIRVSSSVPENGKPSASVMCGVERLFLEWDSA